jgi:excisionase family DNA binding protein
MFLTVKKGAEFLEVDPRHLYYLIEMGEVEAVKIGCVLRILPEELKEYVGREAKRKYKKASCNFIYSGNGGFLFCTLSDNLQTDSHRTITGMEGRRRKLVYSTRQRQKILHKKQQHLNQLELFPA